jgi:GNAT superfamily N-acetyltransferase
MNRARPRREERSGTAPRRGLGTIVVRRMTADDIALIGKIDRSERVEVEYRVVGGRLQARPLTVDVPPWDTEGDGPFSVAHQVAVCTELLAAGAVLLGAFEHDDLLGLAVVDPSFELPMAWLAFLHVSAPARRRGVATALWGHAVVLARASGAESLYVSATPTGSAVGFYLRQGCALADPVHPVLWAKEPDDVHLVLRFAERPARVVGPLGGGGR